MEAHQQMNCGAKQSGTKIEGQMVGLTLYCVMWCSPRMENACQSLPALKALQSFQCPATLQLGRTKLPGFIINIRLLDACTCCRAVLCQTCEEMLIESMHNVGQHYNPKRALRGPEGIDVGRLWRSIGGQRLLWICTWMVCKWIPEQASELQVQLPCDQSQHDQDQKSPKAVSALHDPSMLSGSGHNPKDASAFHQEKSAYQWNLHVDVKWMEHKDSCHP